MFLTWKHSTDSPHNHCSGIKALHARKEAIKYLLLKNYRFESCLPYKMAQLALLVSTQNKFVLYTKDLRFCVVIICLFCANTLSVFM